MFVHGDDTGKSGFDGFRVDRHVVEYGNVVSGVVDAGFEDEPARGLGEEEGEAHDDQSEQTGCHSDH